MGILKTETRSRRTLARKKPENDHNSSSSSAEESSRQRRTTRSSYTKEAVQEDEDSFSDRKYTPTVEYPYSLKEMKAIKDHVAKYVAPKDNSEAWWYLCNTLVFIGIATYALQYTMAAVPFLSMGSVRLFIIFHDMGHRSYFGDTSLCDWNKHIAALLSPIVCYAAEDWRVGHNNHHAVHGNKSLTDNTKTLITVREYEALPSWQQWVYRILRSPPIFFSVAPFYIFYWTNLTSNMEYLLRFATMLGGLYAAGGTSLVLKFLLGQYIGVCYGTMAFHLQHQVNIGYWKEYDKEDAHAHDCAQLAGSSMLEVPFWLKYCMFGIEYHHIHHLSTRVPGYKIQRCHEEAPRGMWRAVARISALQAVQSTFHVLYDEDTERYISFPLAA
eukprot:GSChrysophyteH2.ASY1.ANO1.1565.1 assembled CDS